jgi:beta-lactamase class A
MAFVLGMVLAMFAGLYKWAMIASVQGPWKAKEALGSGAMAATKPGGKKRRKTRLALVVPLAVSCLIVLGMMALQKSSGQRPNPWWVSASAVSPS